MGSSKNQGRFAARLGCRSRCEWPVTSASKMTIEILESRIAPAVLTVSNLSASGAGSLANAIASSKSGDTIVFAHGLAGAIDLGGTALSINHQLTIAGPGAGKITLDGQNESGILNIQGFSTK